MYCSCDYYDNSDGEPIKFWHEENRNARKQHKCYQCRRLINPKEQYHYTKGMWGDYIGVYKHCDNCWSLLTWLKNNLPCYCYSIEDLFEYAVEQICDAERRSPDETKGLFMDFQRRYYKIVKKVCRYGN